MLGFKLKDPVQEVVNNHVVRTVLEAKYSIKDLSLSEITIIRQALNRQAMNSYGYYAGNPSAEEALLSKIQL